MKRRNVLDPSSTIREVRASMILASDEEFPWLAWMLGEMPWLDELETRGGG